jgi:predicted ATPase
VKTTEHFDFQNRLRRIKLEWCERVVDAPLEVQEQSNGYFRYWGYIEEVERYLRVVTLEDRKTIETAHFDRNYGKRRR